MVVWRELGTIIRRLVHVGEQTTTITATTETTTNTSGNKSALVDLYDYRNYTEYQVALAISTYVGPTIFFMAIVGNCLALLIFTRKALRSMIASHLYIILAIVDAGAVFFLEIIYVHEWFGSASVALSPAMCKASIFLHLTLHTLSPWVVVVIALLRFVCVVMPHRARKMNTSKHYMLLLLIITAIIIGCHWPVIISSGFVGDQCFAVTHDSPLKSWDVRIFIGINLTLTVVIPFILLFTFNIAIIGALLNIDVDQSHELYTGVAMLFGVSLVFVILNIPSPVALWVESFSDPAMTIYTHDYWQVKLFREIGVQLSSFNHCINIFIYPLTGAKFRRELRRLVCCKKVDPEEGKLI